MSATCQNPFGSVEGIDAPAPQSWPAYLFQGNLATAAYLKIKALLSTLKAKSAQRPPRPDRSENPPQNPEVEDYWNDPMLWMLMFH
jgi:hypothetical protein